MTLISKQDITGLILAGGRGSRFGGADKGLVRLHDRPMIEYAIDALRPQVSRLLISANRHREAYEAYGLPVIADVIGDYHGPLVGVLSAMRAADTAYLLTVPCDAPAIPPDIAERLSLALAADRREISIASCGGRVQPVFALVSCSLADRLQQYLTTGGRGVEQWARGQQAAIADFPEDGDLFANINTPEQLQRFQERTA